MTSALPLSICRPAGVLASGPAAGEFASLFRRLALLYTGGYRSTLASEEAITLIESISFVLGANPSCPWGGPPPQSSLEREFERRRSLLADRARSAMRTWRRLVAIMPPIKNIALRDTLASIEGFESRYDTLFAAHKIPASIDYPLRDPVSDDLLGVLYLEEWLRRAYAEAEDIAALDLEESLHLLERRCPDYRGLHVNLHELLIGWRGPDTLSS